jgi:hypothetical protein
MAGTLNRGYNDSWTALHLDHPVLGPNSNSIMGIPVQTQNRRTFLSTGLAMAAGVPLLTTTRFAQATSLPPALPPATVTQIAGQINAFVTASRTGGQPLITATNRLVGSLDTVYSLWNSNGTTAYLQSQATPAAIAAFQFNDATRAKLASASSTVGVSLPATDLVKIEANFPTYAGPFAALSSPGGVSSSLNAGLGLLSKFATEEGGGGGGGPTSLISGRHSPHILRAVFPQTTCWYGLYAAECGLWSALSWEVPPLAALFAALAFIWGVIAVFMC